jgi:putative transposase
MKFEFILKHRSEWRVSRMCRALGTSEAGYYAWRKRPPSRRSLEDMKLLEAMKIIHEENHRTYGAGRMQTALARLGMKCSQGRIRRLMRENGLYTVHGTKHRPYPKEAAETPSRENVLDRHFQPERPNEAWEGDITYVRSDEGWGYLATVIDLFHKEIVGHATSRKPGADLVTRAMQHAIQRREPGPGLVFHSDQGVQYRSVKFRSMLEENEIRQSMSRKGCPYDNAPAESFFATLRKEWLNFKRYATFEAAETSLFEYIEIFYNRKRMHTSLGNLSPVQYLEKYLTLGTS